MTAKAGKCLRWCADLPPNTHQMENASHFLQTQLGDTSVEFVQMSQRVTQWAWYGGFCS